MKKKLYSSVVAVTLATTLAGVISPAVVNADTTNEAGTENTDSQTVTSSNQNLELADKYVNVENNTFVLSQEGKNTLPASMVTQVEAKLAKTNNVIKKDRLIIDPETKEIVQYSPYTIFAASVKGANRLHSGCYYKFFWWGVRIYFTSNAAVSWFRGYLSSGSKIAGLVGTIFSGTGHEITGITASTASRYLSMSSGMLYMYNKRHSKSKICMDIPSLSFHTF